VLVVVAMPIEMKPFVRMLALTKGTLGRSDVFTGSIARSAGTPGSAPSNTEIVGAVTGIGPERARDTVERLLDATSVDHIVMIGVAGALDPGLRIGDLVVPEVVWDADTSESHRPVPVQDVATSGTLRTSGVMLTDAQALAPDRARGVIALDMETAAVAAVSAKHHIAFSAFRAISDRVQDGIVDESTLKMTNADGSANVWGAVKTIASRPSMLPKLSKLLRDVRTATEVAATAGVRECQAIADA
jgi:adenosylhomocysteine nucleosidase